MNRIFETNINCIIKIINKRIKITKITLMILLIPTTIFTIIYPDIFFYFIIFYVLILILLIIYFVFHYTNYKLNTLLKTYQNNKQDVVDYLNISITHAKYNQHNFLLRLYYGKIVIYYINALNALKKL